jgi:hypothetical protein
MYRFNILDYCYHTHFSREFRTFNENDVKRFSYQNEFFLEGVQEEEIYFEFAFYHFYKWVKRMNLSVPKDEIRKFLKEKEL